MSSQIIAWSSTSGVGTRSLLVQLLILRTSVSPTLGDATSTFLLLDSVATKRWEEPCQNGAKANVDVHIPRADLLITDRQAYALCSPNALARKGTDAISRMIVHSINGTGLPGDLPRTIFGKGSQGN